MYKNSGDYIKYKNEYLKLKTAVHHGGTNGNGAPKDPNCDPIDVLHFWGNQFTEHAYMLHLMIEENNTSEVLKELTLGWKQEALGLHDEWKNYMKKTFEDRGIQKTKIML